MTARAFGSGVSAVLACLVVSVASLAARNVDAAEALLIADSVEQVENEYLMWVVLTARPGKAAAVIKEQYDLPTEEAAVDKIKAAMDYFEKEGQKYEAEAEWADKGKSCSEAVATGCSVALGLLAPVHGLSSATTLSAFRAGMAKAGIGMGQAIAVCTYYAADFHHKQTGDPKYKEMKDTWEHVANFCSTLSNIAGANKDSATDIFSTFAGFVNDGWTGGKVLSYIVGPDGRGLIPNEVRFGDHGAPTGLSLPSDGTTVVTPFTLEAGVRYRIDISGTFQYDVGEVGQRADAQYREHDDRVWRRDNWVAFNGKRLDADEADLSEHNYGFFMEGGGETLSLRVVDDDYKDNAGALHVTVVPLGEPPRELQPIIEYMWSDRRVGDGNPGSRE